MSQKIIDANQPVESFGNISFSDTPGGTLSDGPGGFLSGDPGDMGLSDGPGTDCDGPNGSGFSDGPGGC